MDKDKLTEVIIGAKNGSKEAFEELFRMFRDSVYFLALKTVRNHNDALDIVQETFSAVFQNIQKLENEKAFKGWLCQITINKCKRFWERKKDMFISSDDGQVLGEIIDYDEDFLPQSVLDKAETRNMIMSLIDSLPDEQRMSVMLYYYEELKVEEIAGIMECPVNTVKSRLFYARRQIKEGVESFEKRGDKLYGIGALPVLALLLKEAASENAVPEDVLTHILENILKNTGAAVSAAGGKLAGVLNKASYGNSLVKIVSLPLKTKIIACVVSGAVLIAGVAAPILINSLLNNRVDVSQNNQLEDMPIFNNIKEVTGSENALEKAEPVNFADKEFEKCIRLILDKPEGEIYTSDLRDIKNIYIYGKSINKIKRTAEFEAPVPEFSYELTDDTEYYDVSGTKYIGKGEISSLEDIKYFENLESVTVCYNKVANIEVLQNLKNLKGINLCGNNVNPKADLSAASKLEVIVLSENQMTDISGIKFPAGLKQLFLEGNNITSVSSLSELTNLLGIDLSNNKIEDISPLKNMEKLKIIFMPRNKISDISALQNMYDLESAVLFNNNISSLSGLNGKIKLKVLNIQNNRITDIGPLRGLTSLEELWIYDNNIGDITPLKDITSLRDLNMMRNSVSDLSPLKKLTNLQKINFNENKYIIDITPLSNLINLKELILGYNSIQDISALRNLKNLEVLWLNSNLVSDIGPLSNLSNLKVLYLISNRIEDVSPLRNLTGLTELHIQDNIMITDFSPLSGLKNTKIERDWIN